MYRPADIDNQEVKIHRNYAADLAVTLPLIGGLGYTGYKMMPILKGTAQKASNIIGGTNYINSKVSANEQAEITSRIYSGFKSLKGQGIASNTSRFVEKLQGMDYTNVAAGINKMNLNRLNYTEANEAIAYMFGSVQNVGNLSEGTLKDIFKNTLIQTGHLNANSPSTIGETFRALEGKNLHFNQILQELHSSLGTSLGISADVYQSVFKKYVSNLQAMGGSVESGSMVASSAPDLNQLGLVRSYQSSLKSTAVAANKAIFSKTIDSIKGLYGGMGKSNTVSIAPVEKAEWRTRDISTALIQMKKGSTKAFEFKMGINVAGLANPLTMSVPVSKGSIFYSGHMATRRVAPGLFVDLASKQAMNWNEFVAHTTEKMLVPRLDFLRQEHLRPDGTLSSSFKVSAERETAAFREYLYSFSQPISGYGPEWKTQEKIYRQQAAVINTNKFSAAKTIREQIDPMKTSSLDELKRGLLGGDPIKYKSGKRAPQFHFVAQSPTQAGRGMVMFGSRGAPFVEDVGYEMFPSHMRPHRQFRKAAWVTDSNTALAKIEGTAFNRFGRFAPTADWKYINSNNSPLQLYSTYIAETNNTSEELLRMLDWRSEGIVSQRYKQAMAIPDALRSYAPEGVTRVLQKGTSQRFETALSGGQVFTSAKSVHKDLLLGSEGYGLNKNLELLSNIIQKKTSLTPAMKAQLGVRDINYANAEILFEDGFDLGNVLGGSSTNPERMAVGYQSAGLEKNPVEFIRSKMIADTNLAEEALVVKPYEKMNIKRLSIIPGESGAALRMDIEHISETVHRKGHGISIKEFFSPLDIQGLSTGEQKYLAGTEALTSMKEVLKRRRSVHSIMLSELYNLTSSIMATGSSKRAAALMSDLGAVKDDFNQYGRLINSLPSTLKGGADRGIELEKAIMYHAGSIGASRQDVGMLGAFLGQKSSTHLGAIKAHYGITDDAMARSTYYKDILGSLTEGYKISGAANPEAEAYIAMTHMSKGVGRGLNYATPGETIMEMGVGRMGSFEPRSWLALKVNPMFEGLQSELVEDVQSRVSNSEQHYRSRRALKSMINGIDNKTVLEGVTEEVVDVSKIQASELSTSAGERYLFARHQGDKWLRINSKNNSILLAPLKDIGGVMTQGEGGVPLETDILKSYRSVVQDMMDDKDASKSISSLKKELETQYALHIGGQRVAGKKARGLAAEKIIGSVQIQAQPKDMDIAGIKADMNKINAKILAGKAKGSTAETFTKLLLEEARTVNMSESLYKEQLRQMVESGDISMNEMTRNIQKLYNQGYLEEAQLLERHPVQGYTSLQPTKVRVISSELMPAAADTPFALFSDIKALAKTSYPGASSTFISGLEDTIRYRSSIFGEGVLSGLMGGLSMDLDADAPVFFRIKDKGLRDRTLRTLSNNVNNEVLLARDVAVKDYLTKGFAKFVEGGGILGGGGPSIKQDELRNAIAANMPKASAAEVDRELNRIGSYFLNAQTSSGGETGAFSNALTRVKFATANSKNLHAEWASQANELIKAGKYTGTADEYVMEKMMMTGNIASSMEQLVISSKKLSQKTASVMDAMFSSVSQAFGQTDTAAGEARLINEMRALMPSDAVSKLSGSIDFQYGGRQANFQYATGNRDMIEEFARSVSIARKEAGAGWQNMMLDQMETQFTEGTAGLNKVQTAENKFRGAVNKMANESRRVMGALSDAIKSDTARKYTLPVLIGAAGTVALAVLINKPRTIAPAVNPEDTMNMSRPLEQQSGLDMVGGETPSPIPQRALPQTPAMVAPLRTGDRTYQRMRIDAMSSGPVDKYGIMRHSRHSAGSSGFSSMRMFDLDNGRGDLTADKIDKMLGD